MGRKLNRQIAIHGCHGNPMSQAMSYQKNHQIVFHDSECLSLAKKENVTETYLDENNDPNQLDPSKDTTNNVVFLKCNATNGEKWLYDETVSIGFC